MALAIALSVVATTGTGIVLCRGSSTAWPATGCCRVLGTVSRRFATPVASSIIVGLLIVILSAVYYLATSVQNAFFDVIDVTGLLFSIFTSSPRWQPSSTTGAASPAAPSTSRPSGSCRSARPASSAGSSSSRWARHHGASAGRSSPLSSRVWSCCWSRGSCYAPRSSSSRGRVRASMKAVVFYESADDLAEKAPLHAGPHRARWREFADRGELLMIGPFANALEDGAMGIFTTREAAEEFVRGDPFVLHGVVRNWTIREWNEALVPNEPGVPAPASPPHHPAGATSSPSCPPSRTSSPRPRPRPASPRSRSSARTRASPDPDPGRRGPGRAGLRLRRGADHAARRLHAHRRRPDRVVQPHPRRRGSAERDRRSPMITCSSAGTGSPGARPARRPMSRVPSRRSRPVQGLATRGAVSALPGGERQRDERRAEHQYQAGQRPRVAGSAAPRATSAT